ncbi:MAG TPA: riboflavin biosynthesis protein RibF [Trueperaceae bacterium]
MRTPVQVVDTPDALALQRSVVCPGNFDGVHLGHQLLLSRMQELAAAEGLPSVIITFFPPAKTYFRGGAYLSGQDEKTALLARFEPTAIVMIHFDHAYAQTPKGVFLDQLRRLSPRAIIVGEDFRFGHDRAGGLDDLQHVTEKLEVFGKWRQDGEAVSSSRVRRLLEEGQVEAANQLLGYPYLAKGVVVQGDHRGRTIGFPTANVRTPEGKALPIGAFAVTVDTRRGTHLGMASTGPRPGFPDNAPPIEVHLFDFQGDLYEERITVHFHHFLHAQMPVDGLEALKRLLQDDESRARELLANTALHSHP